MQPVAQDWGRTGRGGAADRGAASLFKGLDRDHGAPARGTLYRSVASWDTWRPGTRTRGHRSDAGG